MRPNRSDSSTPTLPRLLSATLGRGVALALAVSTTLVAIGAGVLAEDADAPRSGPAVPAPVTQGEPTERTPTLSRSADRVALQEERRAERKRLRQHRARTAATIDAKRSALDMRPGSVVVGHVKKTPKQVEPTEVSGAPEVQTDYKVGGNRALGLRLMLEHGFARDQWPALEALWTRESGWNHLADNPNSSAYGIPQALPGSKMASAGADWATNPATQIRWGLGYIADRYGTPSAALAHSDTIGWY